MTQDKCELHK